MKNQKPLVSVVIPSYNHEQYIEKAILSVIEQTYNNIELIVIDDGSIDNSDSILTKLSNKYQFQYIHRMNKGLIKTLNEALDIIQGEYFCMLGSDDYFVNNKIELQVEFFQRNKDYALCYGNITFIDELGNIKKDGNTDKFCSGMIYDNLLYENFIPLPSVMMKSNIAKEYRFDERFFLEDYPLWLKISQKYKIGFIKSPLTFYRQHRTNVSKNTVKMIREEIRILSDHNRAKNYEKVMKKRYLKWFIALAKTHDFELTHEYMQKAFSSSFYKIAYLKACLKYFIKSKFFKK